jgi:non-heme chloroperoxidase
LALRSLTAILLLCGSLVASGQPPSRLYKPHAVRSPDGVTLAVQEWGNPTGPEILFIHGFAQSNLSWSRQVKSDLAKDFRLVTFDLRGHGNSDKPLVPEAYRDSKHWAADIDAIIRQTGLRKPVLVGWSFGGRVINDYLTHYGDASIGGINYVAAATVTKPGMLGPIVGQLLPLMASDDLATNIEATRRFLVACFKVQPSADHMATALASSMMVPPAVRSFFPGRQDVYDSALGRLSVPVLVTQGRDDLIVLPAQSEHMLTMVKHARGSFYDDVGHEVFYEAADRFNAELAAFVTAILAPSHKP